MIPVLYDHQAAMKQETRDWYKAHRSILLQSATGSGKTQVAVSVIKDSLGKGKTIWFVAPRKELLNQISNCMRDWEINHSFIAAGRTYNPHAYVHIVSLQSFASRMDDIKPPDFCIIDEIHYGGAGLTRLVEWLVAHGVYILALSATPERMDGRGLGDYCQYMVRGPSIRWLIDNKFLSQYRAFAPSKVDLKGIRTIAGEYNQKQLAERMESDRVLVGSAIRHYKQHAEGKLAVAFAVGIKHSQILEAQFKEAGIIAKHIDGTTPEDERRRIARAFAMREIQVLTSAELLCFGWDLASASGIKGVSVQCLIDCQPTKSLPKQLQKWGRGLRYDGETHIFLDHANNFETHGLPCEEREWSLDGRGKRSQERSINVRQCSKCYACHYPAAVCPMCGYVYPVESRAIEEIDGDLTEMAISDEKKEIERKMKRMEVGRAKTQEDLERIADERNYHWGWVKRQCMFKRIPYKPRSLRGRL